MIDRATQIALYAYTAGVLNARHEYETQPIAFATDPLCETCQTKPRDEDHRKYSTCRKKKP